MYAKCIHILYIIWSFKYFFTVLLTHTDKKVLFCCNISIRQLIPLMVSKPAGIFARFFRTYYFLFLAHFSRVNYFVHCGTTAITWTWKVVELNFLQSFFLISINWILSCSNHVYFCLIYILTYSLLWFYYVR